MVGKTISRNAPCHCGSGRKYKHCCLNKQEASDPDRLWRRVRQADDKLADLLMRYAANNLGGEVILEAWEDFVLDSEDLPFDRDSFMIQVFLPWFLFHWRSADWDEDEDYDPETGRSLTIAERFLKQRKRQLTDLEQRFLQTCISGEFSFHEVLSVEPGSNFSLRDLLLEREVTVMDRSASQSVDPKSILFAKIIEFEGMGFMVGCSPQMLTPIYKVQIANLRNDMRLGRRRMDNTALREYEDDIRKQCFELQKTLTRPLALQNTDGDPLVLCKMSFSVSSPAEAFEKLWTLNLNTEKEELLADAEYDRDGNLQQISFPCLKKSRGAAVLGEYISYGSISIDGKNLRVETNSENRAQKLRREIEKRLGKKVCHLQTDIESIETAMEKPGRLLPSAPPEELPPEILAIMEERLAAHWEQWIDDSIPMLGGLTPRQAVKSKIGRDRVVALLDDIEYHELNKPKQFDQLKFIQLTRKRLGLAR